MDLVLCLSKPWRQTSPKQPLVKKPKSKYICWLKVTTILPFSIPLCFMRKYWRFYSTTLIWTSNITNIPQDQRGQTAKHFSQKANIKKLRHRFVHKNLVFLSSRPINPFMTQMTDISHDLLRRERPLREKPLIPTIQLDCWSLTTVRYIQIDASVNISYITKFYHLGKKRHRCHFSVSVLLLNLCKHLLMISFYFSFVIAPPVKGWSPLSTTKYNPA